MISLKCGIENKQKQTNSQIQKIDWWCVRGRELGVGEIDEGGQNKRDTLPVIR